MSKVSVGCGPYWLRQLFSKAETGSSKAKKLTEVKADGNGAFTAFWESETSAGKPSAGKSSTRQQAKPTRPSSNSSGGGDPHLMDGGAIRSGSSRLPSSSHVSRSEASSRTSAQLRILRGSPMTSASGEADPQLLPPAALLSRNQRSGASLGGEPSSRTLSQDGRCPSRCLLGPRLASARSVNLLLGAFSTKPRARQLKPLAVAFPGYGEEEESGLPPVAGSRNAASVPHFQAGKVAMERHVSGRRSDPDGGTIPQGGRTARWQREMGMGMDQHHQAHGSVYLNAPAGRLKAIQVKEAMSNGSTTPRTSTTVDGQGGWINIHTD